MRPEDYPPQEPFSERAQGYHDEAMRRGAGVQGLEFTYGYSPYQSLAVYQAAQPSGDTLLCWHGGGWTNGYKEWLAFMAPALAAAGVTFVSAGYRLAPVHVFPAGYSDCLDALAWVYHNIAAHGGDPERVFVGGHSAGGHYASLMAVSRDWQTPRDLPAHVIRGCLPISGVYRFGEGSGLAVRPRFLGSADNDRRASPCHRIQGVPPPFFMVYGEQDFPHLIPQALEMAEALRAAGGDVVCLELKGCNHFSASYVSGDADGPWVGRAVEWMRER